MPDKAAQHRRLTHTRFLSSDELIVLLEENVEEHAIIVLSPERRIINWSRGAEDIFGYSVEEALDKDVSLIFTPEDISQNVPEQEFQTAIKTGRAADERYHIRKDGSEFWASGSLTALREDEGRVRGAVKIVRDLTERKQLEESLRKEMETAQQERIRAEQERERAEASAREVKRVNGLLRRAMTEAHHRIKNSFQMLSALVEMQDRHDEGAARSNYEKLTLHIRALSAIHDLLTEEAKSAADSNYLEATAMLERLLQLIQNTLVERTIQADIEEMSFSLKQVTSLAPLLNEIVTNAIKHSRGDIEVTLRRESNTARLEVCDDGAGFPADFDPRKAAHTGMDLIEILVRHDVDGEIKYENAAQGGARVIVTFPLTSA